MKGPLPRSPQTEPSDNPHIPVLIEEQDWAQVTAALIQRADLLEALMADLYGPNRLVAAGHLPPGPGRPCRLARLTPVSCAGSALPDQQPAGSSHHRCCCGG